MDNRNRDKMSDQGKQPTGSVNRESSEQRGKLNSDSSSSFGQKIGRSENLNEPSGRTSQSDEGGWESSTGRSGVPGSSSSGSYGEGSLGSSDIESGSKDEIGSRSGVSGVKDRSDRGDSGSRRH
jgi:hypothetical protein